jgi:HSP20 family protein
MRALLPEGGMTTFRKELDRLFDRMWDGDDAATVGSWAPKMDVSETKEAFLVKAEIPGMEPKDIQLTMENGVLQLRGEKRQEEEKKDERYYRVERSYGSFVRTMRLPAQVDADKVNATFKNGLLTIHLPKLASAAGHPIPIQPA